MSDIQEHEMTN